MTIRLYEMPGAVFGANVHHSEMKRPTLPPELENAPIGPSPTEEQLEAIRKYEERLAKGERGGIPHEEAKARLEELLRGRAGRAELDRSVAGRRPR